MYNISAFDSVGQRAIVYHRELEALATTVEDLIEVLRENPDAGTVKYVADRLDERLDAVYFASRDKP